MCMVSAEIGIHWFAKRFSVLRYRYIIMAILLQSLFSMPHSLSYNGGSSSTHFELDCNWYLPMTIGSANFSSETKNRPFKFQLIQMKKISNIYRRWKLKSPPPEINSKNMQNLRTTFAECTLLQWSTNLCLLTS